MLRPLHQVTEEMLRLTKIIKKTYEDGAAVGLIVDKERGCWVGHVYLPYELIIGKSVAPT